MPRFEDQPLRQRKLARTRLALLDALTAQLETQTYEAVRVKDLCAAADISEASFFNYFERKEDLLVYFIQIWCLSVGWHAQRALAERGALVAVREVFSRTAADISAHPRVMSEVIAFQARMEVAPTLRDPTLAERLGAFPDLAGIEALPARGLEVVLPGLLAAAKSRGELPADADLEFLFLNLATLFFGTPVVLRSRDPGAIGAVWQAQLDQLFRAAGAALPQSGGPAARRKR
jgi:AcrR family transcriptional regulator